ncbi:MAG: nucleotide exchange factor GrpE [Candidatus Methanomethylophilaceae archaeon]|nr:nucleotide exchange factor GrpE [Candidatus Methanomethylophilaceae archaeon]
MTGKSRQKDDVPGESAAEDKPKVEPKVEEEKDPLAEAQAKADQYLDMARRLQADFDNYRKRSQRDNEEFRKYACSSIVSDLLTIVDDLDRALEHAGDETDFVKGIRGVRANLMKVLESNGLQEIPADGKFDPNLHEALCTVDGDEDDMIAEVFQKGYTLNGKVLRYTKVKVTRKTA